MRKFQGPLLGAQPDFQGLCARCRWPHAAAPRLPRLSSHLERQQLWTEPAGMEAGGCSGGLTAPRTPRPSPAGPEGARVSGGAAMRAPSPGDPLLLAAQAGCRATCFQAHLQCTAPRCPAASRANSSQEVPVPGTEARAQRTQAVVSCSRHRTQRDPGPAFLSPSLASLRSEARFPTKARQHPLALGKGVRASCVRSDSTFRAPAMSLPLAGRAVSALRTRPPRVRAVVMTKKCCDFIPKPQGSRARLEQ